MVILHFEFWPQDTRKKLTRASRDPNEEKKFCILDKANITLKILVFYILSFLSR
jgi:hypothetical protein